MRFFIFILFLFLGINVHGEELSNLRTYGNNTPVKFYLFTSLACPHCAVFHQDILPEIQEKYVNTKRGQLIIVDMIMNSANLMGATLLRCLPETKIREIESQLYKDQEKWAYDEKKAYNYLLNLASENSLSAGEFESCIHNKDIQKNILSNQETLSHLYGITLMPTLLVRQTKQTKVFEGADRDEIIEGLNDFFK